MPPMRRLGAQRRIRRRTSGLEHLGGIAAARPGETGNAGADAGESVAVYGEGEGEGLEAEAGERGWEREFGD